MTSAFVSFGRPMMFAEVCPAGVVATHAIGRAKTGKGYRLALASTGGVGATKWALAVGSLPSGLRLSSSGVVSGKARRAGRFRFTVTVTDALGAKAAMTYTLRVGR